MIILFIDNTNCRRHSTFIVNIYGSVVQFIENCQYDILYSWSTVIISKFGFQFRNFIGDTPGLLLLLD